VVPARWVAGSVAAAPCPLRAAAAIPRMQEACLGGRIPAAFKRHPGPRAFSAAPWATHDPCSFEFLIAEGFIARSQHDQRATPHCLKACWGPSSGIQGGRASVMIGAGGHQGQIGGKRLGARTFYENAV